jgi:predicted nucleotidyltransferase
MVQDAVIEVVKRYLAGLRSFGIHTRRAVLFGSYVESRADECSDMDLVVIAPEFDGPRELTLVEKLWLATTSVDNRIEPIPCGEQEWETDGSRPILEIARREGVIITVQRRHFALSCVSAAWPIPSLVSLAIRCSLRFRARKSLQLSPNTLI